MNLASSIGLHAGSKNKTFSPVSHLRDKITMKIDPKSGEIDLPKVKAGRKKKQRRSVNVEFEKND
jgi:hypothetical protein